MGYCAHDVGELHKWKHVRFGPPEAGVLRRHVEHYHVVAAHHCRTNLQPVGA